MGILELIPLIKEILRTINNAWEDAPPAQRRAQAFFWWNVTKTFLRPALSKEQWAVVEQIDAQFGKQQQASETPAVA